MPPGIERCFSFPGRRWCSELVWDSFNIVNGRLLFTCRTGNEKRRLILKSLLQNLNIKTPVRNSLLNLNIPVWKACLVRGYMWYGKERTSLVEVELAFKGERQGRDGLHDEAECRELVDIWLVYSNDPAAVRTEAEVKGCGRKCSGWIDRSLSRSPSRSRSADRSSRSWIDCFEIPLWTTVDVNIVSVWYSYHIPDVYYILGRSGIVDGTSTAGDPVVGGTACMSCHVKQQRCVFL